MAPEAQNIDALDVVFIIQLPIALIAIIFVVIYTYKCYQKRADSMIMYRVPAFTIFLNVDIVFGMHTLSNTLKIE